jgi:hypothetical protein
MQKARVAALNPLLKVADFDKLLHTHQAKVTDIIAQKRSLSQGIVPDSMVINYCLYFYASRAAHDRIEDMVKIIDQQVCALRLIEPYEPEPEGTVFHSYALVARVL